MIFAYVDRPTAFLIVIFLFLIPISVMCWMSARQHFEKRQHDESLLDHFEHICNDVVDNKCHWCQLEGNHLP